jgi:hypothetical protein
VTIFRSTSKRSAPQGAAFYAEPKFLVRPRMKEWWTLLHPPYTMLHLSFVAIGACLTGPVNAVYLWVTLAAFFLGVGVGAHALDELKGRPLKTTIPEWQLIAASALGVGGAAALGVVGMVLVTPYLGIFIVVGVVIALGYNLELFDARLHSDVAFALGWGAFPLLTAYFAQHESISVGAVFAGAYAALISQTQRQLSGPARDIRRRTSSIDGSQVLHDGTIVPLSTTSLLRPLEGALRALCWASTVLAVALVWTRFHPH